ncbi:MAG: sensor domain-containing diguanylate cyclase [Eubacterium sp.]|nr:sensor domain-containing diguanylate cyclase [Eubacterium sp.]
MSKEIENKNGVNTGDVLNKIYDISSNLYMEMCNNQEKDHRAIFEDMTELGRTMADADRASFWKWDKKKHELWTTSATGIDKIVIPDNTGLVGKALKEGRVVVTNDPYNDPDFNKAVDLKTGYTTKSVLVMPVANINGDFIGAFQIINKNNGQGFDEVEDVRRLSMAALISGLAMESETFFEESHHDKLTKLKNRMGFYSDFNRMYKKVIDQNRPLSLFISDIDKFKSVNDTYGHNAGDDVLSSTAALLEKYSVEGGAVYRWGGEEFIMMMPDYDLNQCVEKAEEVRKILMATPIDADGNVINITMSFGCWQFDTSISIEDNVSKADGFLYTAKETGRNKVVAG